MPSSPVTSRVDGNSIMNQECREATRSDAMESRPEVSAFLCREWVLFARCSRRRGNNSTTDARRPLMPGIGLGCLKRHYYISYEEKAQMTMWAQTKESWLEKKVLTVIIEREAQMERVHHLSHQCVVKFQQNLRSECEKVVEMLLVELNRVRFLTVKVLEDIDRWRQYARKVGFARYDNHPDKSITSETRSVNKEVNSFETEASLLGWSASITLDTGKQLYKGSKAFVSKAKRFCRDRDINGKREQHVVYLGYYQTQDEAEQAYDKHAASEARRLNTTTEHLPRRRNVFRSCGKHFAVESENNGPSFCIECKTKQLAAPSSTVSSEWTPPFFYGTGVNYIMKMANDLDFLDNVLPLKAALNKNCSLDGEVFPMSGNVFLLPKTPIQDPGLAVFTTFPSLTAPRLGETHISPEIHTVDGETLNRTRILKAQHVFIQELQIYRPELVAEALSMQRPAAFSLVSKADRNLTLPQYRLVEALYWDHCAALKIEQERSMLSFRQPNVGCRPDIGEWTSLVVRGAHQLHYLFEEKLEKNGKEMARRRQQVLTALRQLNKVPLYFVPVRTTFTELISMGQQVRGDVVQLEVNNVINRLHRYDSWCKQSLVIQRWYRGGLGRHKARAVRKALRFACKLRLFYMQQIATTAMTFYEREVRLAAVHRAYKAICAPVYTRAVVMDGETVIVMFHSLRHYQRFSTNHLNAATAKTSVTPSYCCSSCARRFRVQVRYQSHEHKFAVYRGVCTCTLNGGSSQDDGTYRESWFIRAYNPHHNAVYRLRLGALQLQHLVASQARAQLHSEPTVLWHRSLIKDMETSRRQSAEASLYAAFCLKSAGKAANTLANWRRMTSEATQTRQSLTIAYDQTFSLLASTKGAYGASVENARRTIGFTSRPFPLAQVWDPLENANDRRHIVEKRQLSKRLKEAHDELERLRFARFQATHNEQYAQVGANKAQEEYNNMWLPLVKRGNRVMGQMLLRAISTKTRMETFMAQMCTRFLTLRDSSMISTRRHLVLESPEWHAMHPFRIDIPGLRRRRNQLRRRILVVSTASKERKLTRRLVVTVSMSPHATRKNAHTIKDLWVTAYDPMDCSVHNIFLEWELVQLLAGPICTKLCQGSAQAKRGIWRSIADILLSRAILDCFTGKFTLHQLDFYHTLRRLSPRFLSCRMMQDLQAGRKCGQGDEILRQAVAIDGRLCVVVVYENWGDLTFAIYHTASGDFFRLLMPLNQTFDVLSTKPLKLRLWISCVKSNSYAPSLLLHLLKHIRFYQRDNGLEDVRIELQVPAQKRSKRYQTHLRIQTRKVLVSIFEDSAGDFLVLGYDVNSELTYKLMLEREGLHRMIKTSVWPTDCEYTNLTTSSSSLLLRSNRNMLYEWICSRLRFQSMLEHPEKVTAGTSPLHSSLHLRESFQLLNRWIASSSRNPIRTVHETDITRRALALDTAAFSSLQFEQLTLLACERLPFEFEKQYVGTIDWMEAVAASSSRSQTWQPQLPHMRVDFFIKAHTLFARLREELKAETEQRLQRETWAGMEQEDHNAVCNEILSLVESAKEHVHWTWQKLCDLHVAATTEINHWQRIHSELRIVTKSTEGTGRKVSAVVNAAHMLVEDSGAVFLKCVKAWIPSACIDLLDFISVAVPFDSWSPVRSAEALLRSCLHRFERELKPRLGDLDLTFEKIKLQSDDKLEALRRHKTQVVQFCYFLTHHSNTFTLGDDVQDVVPNVKNAVVAEVESVKQQDAIAVADLTPVNILNTGILIPSSIKVPMEEVFVVDMPTWTPSSPTSSFACYAQAMIIHLRAFFQQVGSQRKPQISDGNGDLTYQRVHYGVLVYQTTAHNTDTQDQLNPRATALTGGQHVCGLALFWPLQQQAACRWYQRLLDCAAVFASISTNSELDDKSHKRSSAVRSVKCLPWKEFAIERLRIARSVKQSRMNENVCVDSQLNAVDQAEKEERTLTTASFGFRQLELSLGERKCHQLGGNEGAIECIKHLFALHSSKAISTHDAVTWQLSLDNPRKLHNVVNLYDSEGRAIQIPCIGRGNTNVITMKEIHVEIDDVDKPRRLIFSCQELETQRQYVVDCDFHDIQYLLQRRNQQDTKAALLVSLQDEVKWRNRAKIMPMHDWRKGAAMAAQLLVFRKKNGVLSLCLDLPSPDGEENASSGKAAQAFDGCRTDGMSGQSKEHKALVHLLKGANELADNPEKTVLMTQTLPSSMKYKCRADVWEERSAVERAMMQTFRKHQPAIRAAACGRIVARTASISSHSAYEWMQMTREDWCSQELRGILVLDANVVRQLENAYTPATTRARDYLKSSTEPEDIGGLQLQLTIIAKAMGHTALVSHEVDVLQSIRMRRWRRRGKEADVVAKRAEAYLADVAEWWRQLLPTLEPIKKR